MDYHSVVKDVTKLMMEFSSKESFAFSDFRKLWMDYKFYFIHCIFVDAQKKTHSLSVMFQAVTEAACTSSSTILERVAAVYLWYCLFVSQPQPGYVRIRVHLDDWQELQYLHHKVRELNHHNVDYIICKLKSFSAFHICVSRQKLCLGKQGETTSKQLQNLAEESMIALEEDIIPNLISCQESFKKYTSFKLALSDHLPPHLLNCSSPFDPLLTSERQQQLRKTLSQGGEEEEGEKEDDEEDVEETHRQKVLRKAGKINPKRVLKRRNEETRH